MPTPCEIIISIGEVFCPVFEYREVKLADMRILIMVLVMVGAVSTATAQRDISFEEALAEMLDNNADIKASRYSVDVAYNELRATRGLRLPKIDVMGGFALMQRDVSVDLGGAKGVLAKGIGDFINKGVSDGLITAEVAQLLAEGMSPLTSIDWRYTLQKRSFGVVGATVVQPIYMGGSINIANRAAKLTLDMATHTLDAVESRLLTELVERYFGVVVTRRVCDVRRDAVSAMSRHLSDAKAMEEEGVVAHSVVVFLEYKLADAERALQDARSKARVAELALRTTVGIGQSINPIGEMFLCNDIYSLDYYRDMARLLNPIICEAELGARLANEGVKLARAAMLPEVVAMGAGAVYSYQLSDMVPRWSVGVGVRIPIFDGLGKEYRYVAAKSEAASVQSEVESAISNILLLIDKEYYTLHNAIANISATERAISFAEVYYNSAVEGFREGVAASSDVVDACVELAAANVEHLNAVYESMLSLARLLEASGLSDTFMEYMNNGQKLLM